MNEYQRNAIYKTICAIQELIESSSQIKISAFDDDRWVTLGGGKNEWGEGTGRHIKIDEHGNVVGGSIPKSAQGKPINSWWKNSNISNPKLSKSINGIEKKLRAKKREYLYVLNQSGEIIHSEGGAAKGHTGYENVDYKGTIAIHNHPPGYYPFPSIKDIETFEKEGVQEMRIVSPNATIILNRTPKSRGFGLFEDLSYNESRFREEAKKAAKSDIESGKSKGQAAEDYISIINKHIKEFATRNGYNYEYIKSN